MSETGLPSATPAPSASGARLAGDDLQHLIGWYHLLRMLRPENRIMSVTLESRGAGNLDDVVIEYSDDHADYYQVKAAVSAETALNSDWLLASGERGHSILQRFHSSWLLIRKRGIPAQLEFVTNRSLDPNDPVLQARDRRGFLADRLRRAPAGSPAAKGRAAWAEHLGVSEEELCDLLDVLRVSTDAIESNWRMHVTDVSQGLGLKTDEASIRAGIAQVREWIKGSAKARVADDVHQAIRELRLEHTEPYAVLIIQALERFETTDTVTTLDWVDRFAGDSDRTRRGLRSPVDWNEVLLPELQETARRLIQANRRILIRGEMRLPVWFAAGTALTEVAGARPAASQHGEIWSSEDNGAEQPQVLVMDERPVGDGADLALVIAVSTDITATVRSYLQRRPEVGTQLTLSLAPGPDRRRIGSGAEAMSAAVALRDRIRILTDERHPPTLHLFLAMPGGLALLLGHLWDRMPPTQVYEDMIDGYQEAFLIRN